MLLEVRCISTCVFVCTNLQVVCEKGLGVNGMSLTSLKEEGFKAVFVGIGKETEKKSIWLLSLLCYIQSSTFLCFDLRSPSGQQSWNLQGFNHRSGLFHLQRLSTDGGLSQQDRCGINPGCFVALVKVKHLHFCISSSRNVPVPFCSTRVEGCSHCSGGWWHCFWLRNLSTPLWSQESVCLL